MGLPWFLSGIERPLKYLIRHEMRRVSRAISCLQMQAGIAAIG